MHIICRQHLSMYDGSDIYIIIDELADLMTTSKKDITPLLQRICQLGRAARIHVIACTQCPLASVIATPIKVNMSAIMGLHTRSRQDSRNIIGKAGCEALPLYGKGIWITPHSEMLVSIPLIQDSDIVARIDSHCKHRSAAVPVPALLIPAKYGRDFLLSLSLASIAL